MKDFMAKGKTLLSTCVLTKYTVSACWAAGLRASPEDPFARTGNNRSRK